MQPRIVIDFDKESSSEDEGLPGDSRTRAMHCRCLCTSVVTPCPACCGMAVIHTSHSDMPQAAPQGPRRQGLQTCCARYKACAWR